MKFAEDWAKSLPKEVDERVEAFIYACGFSDLSLFLSLIFLE